MAHTPFMTSEDVFGRVDDTMRTMIVKRGFVGAVRRPTPDDDFPDVVRWVASRCVDGGKCEESVLAFIYAEEPKLSVMHARQVASTMTKMAARSASDAVRLTAIVATHMVTPQGSVVLGDLDVACATPQDADGDDGGGESRGRRRVQYRANIFTLDELIHDVSAHALQPKHRELPPLTAKEIMETYATTHKQMPVLFTSDPLCRMYDWMPGTVVEFVRRAMHNVPTNTYYRVVAEPEMARQR